MPHSDDEFAEYGTSLDPIEEDDVARKKPITVSEQIATDEKGRRRFHGAFTGGFSAGYFNTVGSKEGWTPSTFKSSRKDRGSFKSHSVLDFMDDEDKGVFGIAPQILRPTDDFTDKNDSRGRKRPWQKNAEGTIPGLSALEQIIKPTKETVGIRILIKMGWRVGKGIGTRIDKPKKPLIELPPDDEDEEDAPMEVEVPNQKMYGCPLPPQFAGDSKNDDEIDDQIISRAQALLAPDDVQTLLCTPKENTFGLGYKGLDRNTLTPATHVDLFGSKLKFRVENKNLSISGQAFGVGAFETNDEDIYSREDMTQYDFALETPEERKRRKASEFKDKQRKNKENCIDGFRICTSSKLKRKNYPAPNLPANFEPFHAKKKSRFETIQDDESKDYMGKGLGRHGLTIRERQVLIEDDISLLPVVTPSVVPVQVPVDKAVDTPVPDKPVTTQVDNEADIKHRIDRLKKFTEVLQSYTKSTDSSPQTAAFKPFLKNPEKQERYDKYLTLLKAGFSECLKDLQPPEMTEWERDREKMEFERASKLYKPLNSILSNRFVSAKSHDISHLEVEKELVKEKDPKDDPKVAAKMKLFGKLTHRVEQWHPDKLVCKRFNVPNPYPESTFVGVRIDPRGNSVNAEMTPPVNQTSFQQPKKYLFENLDFSKPPPGLLPEKPPSSEISTPGPAVKLPEPQQKTSKSDEDEEPVIVKPPLDLFKEIFADSSDSEDEAPEPEPEITVITPEVQRISQANLEKSPENKRAKKDSPKRRVFDKIDLDVFQEKSFDKTVEDMEEDVYGPLPPKQSSLPVPIIRARATTSVSAHEGRHIFQPKKPSDEEVLWVEKSSTSGGKERSKSKKHSSKKSKKKSDKKEKRRKSKKDKHKKKSKKHSKDKDSSDSSDSASSDSDGITINDSLDNRALLAKLKQITRS